MKNFPQFQKLLSNKNNPFPEVVNVFSTTPTILSIQIMDKVREIMNKSDVVLNKYSEIYEVIKFLADNKALTIDEQVDGSYLISNPYGQ